MRNNTVTKSFRLRKDLVDLIELQPGKDMTDKLTSILVEHFKGTKVREQDLESYKEQIKQKKDDISRCNKILFELATIRRESIQIENHFNKVFETIGKIEE